MKCCILFGLVFQLSDHCLFSKGGSSRPSATSWQGRLLCEHLQSLLKLEEHRACLTNTIALRTQAATTKLPSPGIPHTDKSDTSPPGASCHTHPPTHHSQGAAEVSTFCKFLSPLHKWIQHDHGSINISAKKAPKKLAWNSTVEETFTAAPLLKHFSSMKPLVVEVNTSKISVGVVLSQHFGDRPKLHPAVFYSNKLTPMYVVMASGTFRGIKLGLKDWQHWLKEAANPFTICMDHKNLEYLKMAKQLNPCQAGWALFFPCCHFILHYSPDSKNTKADALS